MSNHYHIVVGVDVERAGSWSVEEVLRRWTHLFAGPLVVQRYLSDAHSGLTDAERRLAEALAEGYRARLTDLSWFMRVLNENIARQASREDGTKGHFWEGRFKSQALLGEAAVLSAMACVDLNPLRAGLASRTEENDSTSIQARIKALGEWDAVPSIPATFNGAMAGTESPAYLRGLPWCRRKIQATNRYRHCQWPRSCRLMPPVGLSRQFHFHSMITWNSLTRLPESSGRASGAPSYRRFL
jgi:hypothetical protein